MADTVTLSVVIVDADKKAGKRLHEFVNKSGFEVGTTPTVTSVEGGRATFERAGVNAMYIDIFSIGVEHGLDFIQYVRTHYPHASICLYSTQLQLDQLPGVPEERNGIRWHEKFEYYYKLPKDLDDEEFAKAVKTTLMKLHRWIVTYKANNPVIDTAPKKPQVAEEQKEPDRGEYFVAINGPFRVADASTVAELRKKRGEFEVFVDDDMAEYFIDNKPVTLPDGQVIKLLRLLIERGPGEILDQDVVRQVLGYEVATEKPIRQLYGKLKKALSPKMQEENVKPRRGMGKRVFNPTFTYCYIARRS